mmetsp:Transcript_16112/g.46465  ORF Transcript_16112/g.46465 Transcript_16112/m.46465 type:complete len:107 (-) Transcript_16112:220-540(-)
MVLCFLRASVRRRDRRKQQEVWGTVVKSDQDLNDLLSAGLVVSDKGDTVNGTQKGDSGMSQSRRSTLGIAGGGGNGDGYSAEDMDNVRSAGSGPGPRFEAWVFDQE